jgi:RimJ/RimL family protein N-acetyltransferase
VQLRDGELELRRWTLDDVPALRGGRADVHPGQGAQCGPESVRDHRGGSVVGAIGLDVTESIRQGTIGYWCAREARGRGVTTRALHMLSGHAIDDLRLERLQLFTDPDNHASQRVAEKVGYQREGTVRSHLPQRDGTRRDSIAFSLLPGELT